VSDARELFARYLGQRRELGERVLPSGLPDARTADATGPAEPPRADDRSASVRLAEQVTAGHRATKGAADDATERWRRDVPPIPPPGITVDAPSKDLFATDPLDALDLDALAARVRECTQCRLSQNRTHAVPGEGPARARLVVVGEGPGATEDQTGRPFVGRAGELLTEILLAIGLPREEVYICNVVKCRPPENRKPQPEEILACVPYLHRQLAAIRPAVILAMGGTAAETLLDTRQSLGQLRNRVHRFRGIPLIVTYHPAALLRNPHWKKPTWDDVRIARQLLDQPH
jgi:uracil-DNA glycosylase family 4